jgi:predicted AAA+ superfamily ATPase
LGKVISQNTVNAYIEYLVDSFLVSRANRYDVKGLKYISSPLKYYFTDIGLRNARINFRQQDESHIMENIIYNELLRRRYSVDVGSVTTNAKNAEGKMVRKNLEVDFIANKGDKRYYIQSALELSTEEKWKQEEQSLLSISDSFKKIVIQRQMIEPWYNNHGVLCISVEDFLLNQDSLDW